MLMWHALTFLEAGFLSGADFGVSAAHSEAEDIRRGA